MIFPQKYFAATPLETAEIANEFARIELPTTVINLIGDLGAGKTFFVKKFCKKFGIENVTSPTFAIVNQYKNGKMIYHFDFYRIESPNEIIDLGFNDYLNDEEAVCFIEWGNRFAELLPKKRIDIEFLVKENFEREITVSLRDE